jgi:hypothetical protein
LILAPPAASTSCFFASLAASASGTLLSCGFLLLLSFAGSLARVLLTLREWRGAGAVFSFFFFFFFSFFFFFLSAFLVQCRIIFVSFSSIQFNSIQSIRFNAGKYMQKWEDATQERER